MRLIQFYKVIMNIMINNGVALNRPKLIKLSFKQDKHIVRLMDLNKQYEKVTGKSFEYLS